MCDSVFLAHHSFQCCEYRSANCLAFDGILARCTLILERGVGMDLFEYFPACQTFCFMLSHLDFPIKVSAAVE